MLKKSLVGLTLKKFVLSIIISAIIGSLILSSFFLILPNTNFSLFQLNQNLLSILLFLVIPIGTGILCGALSVYIAKSSELKHIIKITFITGLFILFFYCIANILPNISYILSAPQHYAWSGFLGILGDILFLVIVILVFWTLQILIGTILGGLMIYLIKKNEKLKE
ncbi:MAG: hypothetical protein NT038_00445 [Euryarchaeota archaeon]|nr:hypothetical protein [Euryarchaeota archaeon]